MYFFNYSTWQGQHGLYLEDLYVSPEQRGKGAGKALLSHSGKDCAGQQLRLLCMGACWIWNMPSIEFYDSLGASRKASGSALPHDR